MRLAGSLQLVLLLALSTEATSLNIPPDVEQLPTIIFHTTGPIIALPYDNSVTIRCEARGNPPPEYRWMKDDLDFIPPQPSTIRSDQFTTNGTFVLQNKSLARFQGKYRCYASNKLGTAMTETIELIVPSMPKFPKETIETIVVEEGKPFVLHCNPPEGVPPRKIHWMSIGLQHIDQDTRVSMGTDGSLYFSHALQKDSRLDYCCFADFLRIRTIVQKPAMAVEVKPWTPEYESAESSDASHPVRTPSLLLPSGVQTEKVLLKGAELQLECIPGGYPTPEIEWMKMGEKLTARAKFDNFGKLLTIAAIEECDEGKYMCLAKNSAGQAVHYFDVIVEEPPKWLTVPPHSQLTVIGSDVHIKCSVSGKPQPDITWRKNGQIFEDDPVNNKRVLDDSLVLHNAVPDDSGVYQCEAVNRHGVVLSNINIMVMNMAPLILTEDYREYAVIRGENVTMNCSAFGSPPPTISWAKDETPETIEGERFVALQNGSLQISSLENKDSSEYLCVADNSEGKSSITAVLAVKDPTHIVNGPQDKQVISGTTAQLTCQAEYDKSLEDSFEVLWIKDGEKMTLSTEEESRYFVGDGMLQIMNVNLSDQGVYACVARTRLDQDNVTALLTVLDVPDAPQNVEINELTNQRNIRLAWVPGSDHNSSVIEFIVECEESQWEPGKWKELRKVPGNQATAELVLHGHLNYQFRVYAVNAVGPGPPSEPPVRYKTPPAAPDRNPEDIKIQGHLPNQMDISWEPLLSVEHNGPGLEYKVSYRKLAVEDTWTEQLVKRNFFTVRNTSTFIPYEIKIQSRNSHGWGPEPRIATGYSGEDVPTAAPRDVAVEVINTTVLRVSWTPVPPATLRGHLRGYHVHLLRKRSFLNPDKILDERHTLSFPGKRTHAIVPSLQAFSEYSLTVNVFNKKGNGPSSDPVTFNSPEGVPEQVPILTTSNALKDSIQLVWAPPLVANGILTGYLLQYHHINETTKEVLDSREMNITVPDTTHWQLGGLEEGSLYLFHLSACTRAGCGPPLAQESSTVTPARDGNWRISEAVNTSQSFHIIGGLKPGMVYTVRLMAKTLLDNASIFEDVIQTQSTAVAVQQRNISTKGWFIGTMCAVALLTLVVLALCFMWRKQGGKYAGTPPPGRQDMLAMDKVKEKEDLHPNEESQAINDDTFCEYSDSDEKPLRGSLCFLNGDDVVGDSVSRDCLVDYADGGGEFSEDGSFIGEYSGHKQSNSVTEPNGFGPVTA
ncbi:neural cell adhesion molecule L1-like protein isoform X2 [Syngnathoides biaculeatus]|uniref:neural cell adhesion molecule L1-like protein isoform X2 n=1 Tax=Syngnathoides biaculeatus TaxID=300417 RepID=UPI002ADE3379|nr:neural cell adhesion molecule L1-like protein isoform X2 [Syngnathoides biaculeatus]